MMDTSDTIFRLVAVLKIAGLVETEMPAMLAAGTVEADSAKRILEQVRLLKLMTDQQEMHRPDELAVINAKTKLLIELLDARRDFISATGREQLDSYIRLFKARGEADVKAALQGLK